ncbi:GlcG/HbpS family heme-binding protein [Bosea sp. PAMC 26642]|uniref:GlcG/HbpS family heme-binding protein n=1 Tax=Bosea sp. (strain PAMC 26642) TaxID=1792307 RepID=UPI0009E859A4|nr:heme-binding protein [Bosea sp. PAMC 26642]
MNDRVSAPDLNGDLIRGLLDTAVAAAARMGVAVSIAVVDTGGHLAGFLRMEGVHTATVDVAQAKARSAAAFRRPTRVFAQQLAEGNSTLLAVPGCVPLFGGVPLVRSNRMVGAIGISGASPDDDDAIANTIYDQFHKTFSLDI